MSSRALGSVLCAFTLELAVAVTAAAAQQLSISPTIGVYIPTSELLKAANGQEFKQEIGLAVGGRLGLDFGPRFGILTSIAYVPSDLRLTFNQAEPRPMRICCSDRLALRYTSFQPRARCGSALAVAPA